MIWVSDVKWNQNPEDGGVFSNKLNKTIKIHKYHGCGNMWFLSCNPLGISQKDLHTEDFETAVELAKDVIKRKIETLNAEYIGFINDNSASEFSRY